MKELAQLFADFTFEHDIFDSLFSIATGHADDAQGQGSFRHRVLGNGIGHVWDTLLSEAPPVLADATYRFSQEKGFLFLNETMLRNLNITLTKVVLPSDHICFGPRRVSLVLETVMGYDTVLANAFLRSAKGKGYLYEIRSRRIFMLSLAAELHSLRSSWRDLVLFKLGLFLSVFILLYTTTSVVSFVIQETQRRMIHLTILLRESWRLNQFNKGEFVASFTSAMGLIPVIIGFIFFLFELFDDHALAIMMFMLAWITELFYLLSLRTRASIRFFPKIYMLYLAIFFTYDLSFPYGFSRVTFLCLACHVLDLMFFFWFQFEVPALSPHRNQVFFVITPEGRHMPLRVTLDRATAVPLPNVPSTAAAANVAERQAASSDALTSLSPDGIGPSQVAGVGDEVRGIAGGVGVSTTLSRVPPLLSRESMSGSAVSLTAGTPIAAPFSEHLTMFLFRFCRLLATPFLRFFPRFALTSATHTPIHTPTAIPTLDPAVYPSQPPLAEGVTEATGAMNTLETDTTAIPAVPAAIPVSNPTGEGDGPMLFNANVITASDLFTPNIETTHGSLSEVDAYLNSMTEFGRGVLVTPNRSIVHFYNFPSASTYGTARGTGTRAVTTVTGAVADIPTPLPRPPVAPLAQTRPLAMPSSSSQPSNTGSSMSNQVNSDRRRSAGESVEHGSRSESTTSRAEELDLTESESSSVNEQAGVNRVSFDMVEDEEYHAEEAGNTQPISIPQAHRTRFNSLPRFPSLHLSSPPSRRGAGSPVGSTQPEPSSFSLFNMDPMSIFRRRNRSGSNSSASSSR
eukprot:GILK01010880.1.p1 GENE.GILK01010880.1~~GILK01010880.1.p1  ORF type:complete len:906 (+),score=147.24 GILK01010880.1:327-2720(+)